MQAEIRVTFINHDKYHIVKDRVDMKITQQLYNFEKDKVIGPSE